MRFSTGFFGLAAAVSTLGFAQAQLSEVLQTQLQLIQQLQREHPGVLTYKEGDQVRLCGEALRLRQLCYRSGTGIREPLRALFAPAPARLC